MEIENCQDQQGPLIEGFGIGRVIHSLKKGKKVARKNWNGKNMWLELSEYEAGKMYKEYPLQQHILMKTADNKYVPWLASQTDILSEDWAIVE